MIAIVLVAHVAIGIGVVGFAERISHGAIGKEMGTAGIGLAVILWPVVCAVVVLYFLGWLARRIGGL